MVNGDKGLLAHKTKNFAVRARLDAAGVDDGKRAAAPLGISINTVTRHTGGVLDNGMTPFDQLIKKQRLAHIGTAHNGDYGL